MKIFSFIFLAIFLLSCSENQHPTGKENSVYPKLATDTDNDGLADRYEVSLGLVVGDRDASSLSLDPIFVEQWHLKNTLYLNEDINIEAVWRETIGEKYITVAIVDTGVDANHSDIVLDLNNSFRYSDNSNDPSPNASQLYLNSSANAHGTALAGIVAAKGWNEYGVRGVAPNINLVGLNVFSSPTDANFASALLWKSVDVSSNSWGGGGANSLYDDRTSLEAIESGIKTLREGKGVVYVFASGNDRANANFQSILTSSYVIAVSAVDEKGEFEEYSNFGSNILISAPGGAFDVKNELAIVTTDLAGLKYGMDVYKEHWIMDGNELGDYTNTINGTSASCPIISGVAALILSVNSELRYNDVQYILAKTARQNDLNDSSWNINGAGLHFNHKYGFGVVDASQAVSLAKEFKSLGEIFTINKVIAVEDLPESQEELMYSVNIEESLRIKDVQLNINTDHNNNGKLKIVIESPSGTRSVVAYGDTVLYDRYAPWKFLSVEFLDEDSLGEWKISIEDTGFNNSVTHLDLSIDIQGYKK